MKVKTVSYLLVTVQFGCLIALALTGPWIARTLYLFVLEAAGVLIALWGIGSIRMQDLSILPDVKTGAKFVRRGPYRYIRHPMYAGLLLASLAIVIYSPTLLRIAIWIGLLVDIIIKMHHEERLLFAAYPEYEAYQQQTKRLLPLIY